MDTLIDDKSLHGGKSLDYKTVDEKEKQIKECVDASENWDDDQVRVYKHMDARRKLCKFEMDFIDVMRDAREKKYSELNDKEKLFMLRQIYLDLRIFDKAQQFDAEYLSK